MRGAVDEFGNEARIEPGADQDRQAPPEPLPEKLGRQQPEWNKNRRSRCFIQRHELDVGDNPGDRPLPLNAELSDGSKSLIPTAAIPGKAIVDENVIRDPAEISLRTATHPAQVALQRFGQEWVNIGLYPNATRLYHSVAVHHYNNVQFLSYKAVIKWIILTIDTCLYLCKHIHGSDDAVRNRWLINNSGFG